MVNGEITEGQENRLRMKQNYWETNYGNAGKNTT